MIATRRVRRWLLGCCLLVAAVPAQGQRTARPAARRPLLGRILVTKFGDQDVALLVSGIEYGMPDRWSFTSRYIHMFDTDRDHRPVLNNFSVSVSPGLAGGRVGVGWQRIVDTGKTGKAANRRKGATFFEEARVGLLRSWGDPIGVDRYRTFASAELRASVGGLLSLGIGGYAPVGNSPGSHRTFFGAHVGVGL